MASKRSGAVRNGQRSIRDILAEKARPANALERLVHRAAERSSLTSQLQAVVSPMLAPHCRVASIEGDQMTVHVANASWGTRLRMELPAVERALRVLGDFAGVERIRIRAG